MAGSRWTAVAGIALLGALSACGGDDDAEMDGVVTDTIIGTDVEMVEVPVTVPDTSIVTTEVDVDVDVDTVDVGTR